VGEARRTGRRRQLRPPGRLSHRDARTIDWKTYRDYITQYGGATHWEATLRHITEQGNRVILELQERNTREGFTHVANTVMAYGFSDDGRVKTLDVYVMSLN
jgi:hypothetical protein